MSNCPILGDVNFDHLVRIVSISAFSILKFVKRIRWGQSLRLCKCPVSHQIVTSLNLLTPVTWINYHYSGCQMVSSSLLMLWLILCEEDQSLLHSLSIHLYQRELMDPTLFSKFQYRTVVHFDTDTELFPYLVYGGSIQVCFCVLLIFSSSNFFSTLRYHKLILYFSQGTLVSLNGK